MNVSNELYQRIAAAKVFIDENYSSPIGLDSISQQACLSPYHFHRLFRQIYRHTPHQYLTRKRMEKAQDLLGQNRSVQEVCGEVGFESAGTFSTLFKKQTGQAPACFRDITCRKKEVVREQPRKFIPHCFVDQYKLGGQSAAL